PAPGHPRTWPSPHLAIPAPGRCGKRDAAAIQPESITGDGNKAGFTIGDGIGAETATVVASKAGFTSGDGGSGDGGDATGPGHFH
ncbi:MAG: hypothetical protein TH68_02325, partial [Candidatus Synechococcus spongiarum 142]